MNVNQLTHERGWSVDSLIRPASSGTGNARNVDAHEGRERSMETIGAKGLYYPDKFTPLSEKLFL